jgi:hypothetical protein
MIMAKSARSQRELAAVAVVLFLIAGGLLAHKYYRASRPRPVDVGYALMEYYHELEGRLASGDRAALAELAARLKHGPFENVAAMVGEKVIRPFPHPRRMSYSERGDWILQNHESLRFDPETNVFRLMDSGSTKPTREPPKERDESEGPCVP